MPLYVSHSEGFFGHDAMNQGAGYIRVVCLPMMHSDHSWLWPDTVEELFDDRWGAGLEYTNVLQTLQVLWLLF